MKPSFSEASRFWWRLGWISFGGPTGQIAIMHRELVERKKWIDEERFLHALNYCLMLPGPEAQQLGCSPSSRASSWNRGDLPGSVDSAAIDHWNFPRLAQHARPGRRFFSKAALVTFGGAYAVLPYVAQHAVEHYHWLTPDQMLHGFGLAETTPGPLIMVLQFVGFMGAWRAQRWELPHICCSGGYDRRYNRGVINRTSVRFTTSNGPCRSRSFPRRA